MLPRPYPDFSECSTAFEALVDSGSALTTDLVYTTIPLRLRQLDYAVEMLEQCFDDLAVDYDPSEPLNLDRVIFYAEAFYHASWKIILELRTSRLPGYKVLNDLAISRVRNLVLVHPEYESRPAYKLGVLLKHSDVSLQHQGWPEDDGDRYIDNGLKANAHEFHDALVGLLSNQAT